MRKNILGGCWPQEGYVGSIIMQGWASMSQAFILSEAVVQNVIEDEDEGRKSVSLEDAGVLQNQLAHREFEQGL